MSNNNEMLSLYDFLGKAAGASLGKAVATKAAEKKVKFKTKYISNPYYERSNWIPKRYYCSNLGF